MTKPKTPQEIDKWLGLMTKPNLKIEAQFEIYKGKKQKNNEMFQILKDANETFTQHNNDLKRLLKDKAQEIERLRTALESCIDWFLEYRQEELKNRWLINAQQSLNPPTEGK